MAAAQGAVIPRALQSRGEGPQPPPEARHRRGPAVCKFTCADAGDTVDYIRVNYIRLAMGKVLDHDARASFGINYEKEIFALERGTSLQPDDGAVQAQSKGGALVDGQCS